MVEKDFWNCEFIENGLYFYTFDEFIKDAVLIKKIYNKLTYNEIYMYRWYVYAHNELSIKAKNLIWDYLNNDCPYELFISKCKNIKK